MKEVSVDDVTIGMVLDLVGHDLMDDTIADLEAYEREDTLGYWWYEGFDASTMLDLINRFEDRDMELVADREYDREFWNMGKP